MGQNLRKTKLGPIFLKAIGKRIIKKKSQSAARLLCTELRTLGVEAALSPLNGRPAAALVRDYLHTKGSVREDTRG